MSKSAKHEPDPALVEAIAEFLARIREKRESPGHESAVAALVEESAELLRKPVPSVECEGTYEALAAKFYGESAARLLAFQAACGLLSEPRRDHLLDLLFRLTSIARDCELLPPRHIEAAQEDFGLLFAWLLLPEAQEPL